jgi:hypothetical protein
VSDGEVNDLSARLTDAAGPRPLRRGPTRKLWSTIRLPVDVVVVVVVVVIETKQWYLGGDSRGAFY